MVLNLSPFLKAKLINVTWAHTSSPSQAMWTRQHLQKKREVLEAWKRHPKLPQRNITNQAELSSQSPRKGTLTPVSMLPTPFRSQADANPYGAGCRTKMLFTWKTCHCATILSAAVSSISFERRRPASKRGLCVVKGRTATFPVPLPALECEC